MKTFSDICGDNNPLHLDPVIASESMFGGTIVHGETNYSVEGKDNSYICFSAGELLCRDCNKQLEDFLKADNSTTTD